MNPSAPVTMAENYGSTSVPGWEAPGQSLPFAAQLQQLLGEDFQPDADFFVESWTYGGAAAAESRLRQRQALKDRAQRTSTFQNFGEFVPQFASEEFVRQSQRAYDLNFPSSPAGSAGARPQQEEKFSSNREDHFVASEPPSIEQARRLLGVDAQCDRSQIRTAYRHLVRLNHPDRMAGASARARRDATDRMISLNEAYHLLCGSRA